MRLHRPVTTANLRLSPAAPWPSSMSDLASLLFLGISLWNTFCTERAKPMMIMKKILLLALTALTLTAVAMPHKVAFSKLPKRSQEFVERYFPAAKVISVELDRRSPSSEKYTVYFSDGNEVAFDGIRLLQDQFLHLFHGKTK